MPNLNGHCYFLDFMKRIETQVLYNILNFNFLELHYLKFNNFGNNKII